MSYGCDVVDMDVWTDDLWSVFRTNLIVVVVYICSVVVEFPDDLYSDSVVVGAFVVVVVVVGSVVVDVVDVVVVYVVVVEVVVVDSIVVGSIVVVVASNEQ